ncbi:MAG: hypothetical protein ACI4SX_06415, partial [Candidatus Fimenecus sp.]
SKGASLVSERLPGETGAAYIYGYKTQMQFLYNLEQGDTFTLSLCYGDYEFKVINADAVTGENNVLSRKTGQETESFFFADIIHKTLSLKILSP